MWIQRSKYMTDDDPADGNGPDAVQTVEMIRIWFVWNNKQNLCVLVEAEAKKEFACNRRKEISCVLFSGNFNSESFLNKMKMDPQFY